MKATKHGPSYIIHTGFSSTTSFTLGGCCCRQKNISFKLPPVSVSSQYLKFSEGSLLDTSVDVSLPAQLAPTCKANFNEKNVQILKLPELAWETESLFHFACHNHCNPEYKHTNYNDGM